MWTATLWALVAANAVVFVLNTLGFVAISRQTRFYKLEELWGDSVSARHTILPAWRPMLVATCVVLAVASTAEAVALVAYAVVRRGRITRQDAMAWHDLSALAFLSLDGLVPSIVTQHAVSKDSFRRSVSFATLQFLVNTAFWACKLALRRRHSLAQAFLSAALLVSAGLLPTGLLVATLSGAFRTRVRLHSRTHRAAFVLYTCVDASWMLSFSLRATGVVDLKVAIVFVVLMLLLQLLLPIATHKTLVADTKFWRGLGRYNANARFRDGLRLSELCRGSSQSSIVGADPKQQQQQQQQNNSITSGGNNNNNNSTRRSSGRVSSSTRRRPEMGLEVASAKLQDVIETAYRDKSMLEFENLTIDADVIGKGTTAFVYRGRYKSDAVAVKVFNPAEITEEYVATFGQEIHLMAQLRHRNVLMLYGLCVRPPQICAVFELCESGSLASAMAAAVAAEAWDAEARLRCAFDCASAVAYLHSASVWHRDVKLDNFLVARDGTVKLCDFGESVRRTTAASRGDHLDPPPVVERSSSSHAATTGTTGSFDDPPVDPRRSRTSLVLKLVAERLWPPPPARSPARFASPKLVAHLSRPPPDEPDDSLRLEIVGTVAYMAPELIAAKREYTEAVDVFALGVVLRCVWTAEPDPWPRDLQTFEIFDRVERGERPALGDDCPDPVAGIVTASWAHDCEDRPNADAIRHRLIRALDDLCGPDAVARLRRHASRHPRCQRTTRTTSLVDRLFFATRSFSIKKDDDDQNDEPRVPGGGVPMTPRAVAGEDPKTRPGGSARWEESDASPTRSFAPDEDPLRDDDHDDEDEVGPARDVEDPARLSPPEEERQKNAMPSLDACMMA
ncbi:hypothetical protein CTAYLR_002082 [Chrysophaeum taylorii]|uniref:Protein kinase domain-containing protein n=1 Tax=Chrysophaeum taylorii TaxID=2483200 RepID=A0AAD7XPY2_9STRA|nr:hypothetical protein CTAYLR_002082 [Chrysophaeum taylorii]